MELQKVSNLKAASFYNGSDRTYVQTKLIVELLQRGIEEQIVLSREDIINCYCDFLYYDGKVPVTREYRRISEPDRYGYCSVRWSDREEFAKRYSTRISAMTWFKANLGSAILKGKILAIPIIEL